MQKKGITPLEGNTFSHQQGEKPASDRATNTYFANKIIQTKQNIQNDKTTSRSKSQLHALAFTRTPSHTPSHTHVGTPSQSPKRVFQLAMTSSHLTARRD